MLKIVKVADRAVWNSRNYEERRRLIEKYSPLIFVELPSATTPPPGMFVLEWIVAWNKL